VAEKQHYPSKFFEHQAPDSLRSAEKIVPLLLNLLKPTSVVDVGCGVGGWLSVFRRLGVIDVCGIDGDWVETEQLKIDSKDFRRVCLAEPFRLERRFDLVLSLEVAEHLPLKSAPGFVESLVRLGPIIVFSAAVPFQGGTNHLNEQWPEFWINLFDRYGYQVFDVLRPRIWNMSDVCYWYRQNMLLFIDRQDRPHLDMVANGHSPQRAPVNVVHPELLAAMHAYYEDGDVRELIRRALDPLRSHGQSFGEE
jgi:SAM-dependent methyltransferase